MIIDRIVKAVSLMNAILLLITPIVYRSESLTVGGLPQKVYTLVLNMQDSSLELQNVLSYDVLFGYEKTSDIAKREEALFAVNGMFYDPNGIPYGILVDEGQVINMSSVGTPTLMITEEGQVSLEEITIQGQVVGEEVTMNLAGTNTAVYTNQAVLFDPSYGSSTRVERESVNYLIQDGVITDIVVTDEPVSLRNSDYVLTEINEGSVKKMKIGDSVQLVFSYSNGLQNVEHAFQSGGWLVKDGVNVAKEYEPFIGATTAPNPRTLVGITEDGKLVFKVIDGRNPGVSSGVSGKYAAELMLEEGCVAAAYLDGGASSTMVVDGEVVNQPSGGEEREVAHAITIKLRRFAVE